MAMQIYYASGSPYAWRAVFTLAYKGLDFEHKVLEVSKGETKAPEFLKLNPRGQVPVLVDGDIVIRESLAIMAYLEAAYPEKPIFGTTPQETGRIYERLLDMQNSLGANFQQFALPLVRGMMDEKQTEMKEALTKLPADIALLNEWLETSDYVAGDTVSAADFAVYPVQALMRRVLANPALAAFSTEGIVPFATTAPAVERWTARIEALPGYEESYPPHWRAAAA